ncbi:MAG: ABC transporter ATP-binding protein [Actinobacteria bacterium]|nr:ABC transporter ATP-binding protein [Actinomycetota bacterium]
MISIRDISKEFDGVRALDKVTLSVMKGETFGVIGPNGAGKTTLIRILTGQITPSGGEILLDGEPVNPIESRYRLRVGLVPQEPALYGRLTARENLVLLARLYGKEEKKISSKVDDLLDLAGLEEHAARQARFYSRGMKQRLSLVMGLVHEPELIYMDEPTSGLDPEARSALWELILHLAGEGRSIFITTHNMEEADHICSRLAILVDGSLKEEGTPTEIKGLLGTDRIELQLLHDRTADLDALCRRLDLSWKSEGDKIVVAGVELPDRIPDIVSALAGSIRNFHYREVTLEDAFLRFMREAEE